MSSMPRFPFKQDSHFTKTPNVCFDHLMPLLSGSAFKLLMHLIRKTEGWGKASDEMSYEQIRKETGIKSNSTVASSLRELLALPVTDKEGTVIKEALVACPIIRIKKGYLAGTPTASRYALNVNFQIVPPPLESASAGAARAAKGNQSTAKGNKSLPNTPQPLGPLPVGEAPPSPFPSASAMSAPGSIIEPGASPIIEPAPAPVIGLECSIASSPKIEPDATSIIGAEAGSIIEDTINRENIGRTSLYERDAHATGNGMKSDELLGARSSSNFPHSTPTVSDEKALSDSSVPESCPIAARLLSKTRQACQGANLSPQRVLEMRDAIYSACGIEHSIAPTNTIRTVEERALKLAGSPYTADQVRQFGIEWPLTTAPTLNQLCERLPAFVNAKPKTHSSTSSTDHAHGTYPTSHQYSHPAASGATGASGSTAAPAKSSNAGIVERGLQRHLERQQARRAQLGLVGARGGEPTSASGNYGMSASGISASGVPARGTC
jgi:hypothetical protein